MTVCHDTDETKMQFSIVTISCVWSITHDARAVTTVNKGPMQRKHTNWTG